MHGKQKKLIIVDTPGFFDTNSSITNKTVEKKITSQIFDMTSPGVHAFLIVLRVDRFTPEEKNTVDFIKTIFGEGAAKYCIVIFTREDQLEDGQTIDAFITRSAPLQQLVNICGNRKFVINNRLNGELLEAKTKKLLQMINEMVQNNNSNYYTNAQYQKIEQQRKAEQAKREQEERDKKKAYEEALAAKVI
jgi:GTPase Era involved in 16S rRNA processing